MEVLRLLTQNDMARLEAAFNKAPGRRLTSRQFVDIFRQILTDCLTRRERTMSEMLRTSVAPDGPGSDGDDGDDENDDTFLEGGPGMWRVPKPAAGGPPPHSTGKFRIGATSSSATAELDPSDPLSTAYGQPAAPRRTSIAQHLQDRFSTAPMLTADDRSAPGRRFSVDQKSNDSPAVAAILSEQTSTFGEHTLSAQYTLPDGDAYTTGDNTSHAGDSDHHNSGGVVSPSQHSITLTPAGHSTAHSDTMQPSTVVSSPGDDTFGGGGGGHGGGASHTHVTLAAPTLVPPSLSKHASMRQPERSKMGGLEKKGLGGGAAYLSMKDMKSRPHHHHPHHQANGQQQHDGSAGPASGSSLPTKRQQMKQQQSAIAVASAKVVANLMEAGETPVDKTKKVRIPVPPSVSKPTGAPAAGTSAAKVAIKPPPGHADNTPTKSSSKTDTSRGGGEGGSRSPGSEERKARVSRAKSTDLSDLAEADIRAVTAADVTERWSDEALFLLFDEINYEGATTLSFEQFTSYTIASALHHHEADTAERPFKGYGQIDMPIEGHKRGFRSLTLLAHQSRAVACGYSRTTVHDMATSRMVGVLPIQGVVLDACYVTHYQCYCVSTDQNVLMFFDDLSPNSKRSDVPKAPVVSQSQELPLRLVVQCERGVGHVVYIPHERRIVCGDREGYVRTLQLEKLRHAKTRCTLSEMCIREVRPLSEDVLVMQHIPFVTMAASTGLQPALHPSTVMVAGAGSTDIFLIDAEAGKVIQKRKTDIDADSIKYATFSSKHRAVICCGPKDTELTVVHTEQSLAPLRMRDPTAPHLRSIVGVHCVHDSHQLISIDIGGTVKLWDMRQLSCASTFQVARTRDERPNPAHGIRFDNHLHRLIVLAKECLAYEYDPRNTAVLAHETPLVGLMYNRHTNTVLSVTTHELRQWGLRSGKCLSVKNEIPNVGVEVTCAVLDHMHGRQAFLGLSDGTIAAVLCHTGRQLWAAKAPGSGRVVFVCMVTAGQFLVGLSSGAISILLDPMASTKELAAAAPGHMPQALTSDGQTDVKALRRDLDLTIVATVDHGLAGVHCYSARRKVLFYTDRKAHAVSIYDVSGKVSAVLLDHPTLQDRCGPHAEITGLAVLTEVKEVNKDIGAIAIATSTGVIVIVSVVWSNLFGSCSGIVLALLKTPNHALPLSITCLWSRYVAVGTIRNVVVVWDLRTVVAGALSDYDSTWTPLQLASRAIGAKARRNVFKAEGQECLAALTGVDYCQTLVIGTADTDPTLTLWSLTGEFEGALCRGRGTAATDPLGAWEEYTLDTTQFTPPVKKERTVTTFGGIIHESVRRNSAGGLLEEEYPDDAGWQSPFGESLLQGQSINAAESPSSKLLTKQMAAAVAELKEKADAEAAIAAEKKAAEDAAAKDAMNATAGPKPFLPPIALLASRNAELEAEEAAAVQSSHAFVVPASMVTPQPSVSCGASGGASVDISPAQSTALLSPSALGEIAASNAGEDSKRNESRGRTVSDEKRPTDAFSSQHQGQVKKSSTVRTKSFDAVSVQSKDDDDDGVTESLSAAVSVAKEKKCSLNSSKPAAAIVESGGTAKATGPPQDDEDADMDAEEKRLLKQRIFGSSIFPKQRASNGVSEEETEQHATRRRKRQRHHRRHEHDCDIVLVPELEAEQPEFLQELIRNDPAISKHQRPTQTQKQKHQQQPHQQNPTTNATVFALGAVQGVKHPKKMPGSPTPPPGHGPGPTGPRRRHFGAVGGGDGIDGLLNAVTPGSTPQQSPGVGHPISSLATTPPSSSAPMMLGHLSSNANGTAGEVPTVAVTGAATLTGALNDGGAGAGADGIQYSSVAAAFASSVSRRPSAVLGASSTSKKSNPSQQPSRSTSPSASKLIKPPKSVGSVFAAGGDQAPGLTESNTEEFDAVKHAARQGQGQGPDPFSGDLPKVASATPASLGSPQPSMQSLLRTPSGAQKASPRSGRTPLLEDPSVDGDVSDSTKANGRDGSGKVKQLSKRRTIVAGPASPKLTSGLTPGVAPTKELLLQSTKSAAPSSPKTPLINSSVVFTSSGGAFDGTPTQPQPLGAEPVGPMPTFASSPGRRRSTAAPTGALAESSNSVAGSPEAMMSKSTRRTVASPHRGRTVSIVSELAGAESNHGSPRGVNGSGTAGSPNTGGRASREKDKDTGKRKSTLSTQAKALMAGLEAGMHGTQEEDSTLASRRKVKAVIGVIGGSASETSTRAHGEASEQARVLSSVPEGLLDAAQAIGAAAAQEHQDGGGTSAARRRGRKSTTTSSGHASPIRSRSGTGTGSIMAPPRSLTQPRLTLPTTDRTKLKAKMARSGAASGTPSNGGSRASSARSSTDAGAGSVPMATSSGPNLTAPKKSFTFGDGHRQSHHQNFQNPPQGQPQGQPDLMTPLSPTNAGRKRSGSLTSGADTRTRGGRAPAQQQQQQQQPAGVSSAAGAVIREIQDRSMGGDQRVLGSEGVRRAKSPMPPGGVPFTSVVAARDVDASSRAGVPPISLTQLLHQQNQQARLDASARSGMSRTGELMSVAALDMSDHQIDPTLKQPMTSRLPVISGRLANNPSSGTFSSSSAAPATARVARQRQNPAVLQPLEGKSAGVPKPDPGSASGVVVAPPSKHRRGYGHVRGHYGHGAKDPSKDDNVQSVSGWQMLQRGSRVELSRRGVEEALAREYRETVSTMREDREAAGDVGVPLTARAAGPAAVSLPQHSNLTDVSVLTRQVMPRSYTTATGPVEFQVQEWNPRLVGPRVKH